MTGHAWLLIALIVLPFLGALLAVALAAFCPGREKTVALISCFLAFILACRLLVAVSLGEALGCHFSLPLALSIQFSADYLAALMAFIIALVMLPVALFSCDFVTHERGRCEYFACLTALLGALMGIAFSQNLVWIFFFMETASLCLWRLAGLRRGELDIEKANRMFIADNFGSLLFLLGLVAVYVEYGSVTLPDIKGEFMSGAAVALLVAGLFAKAGLLPFSSRLESSSGMPATAGVSANALVSAVCGAYVFARIFCVSGRLSPAWSVAIIFSAGLGALVSAGAALIENDMRRALTCLSASQSGLMFIGLAAMNKSGAGGGLLCLLVYCVARAGLFLCSGVTQQRLSSGDMARAGGLLKTLPVTAAVFAVCCATVMGLPPFGGFFCQLLLLKGLAAFGNPVLLVILLAALLMQALVPPRIFYLVFLGPQQTPVAAGTSEAGRTQLAALVFVAAVCLAIGLLIYYPAHYIEALCLQLGVGAQ